MAAELHPNAPKVDKEGEINWGRTFIMGALMASAAAGAFGSKFMRDSSERAENLSASLEIVSTAARERIVTTAAFAMGVEEGLAEMGVSFGPMHESIMNDLGGIVAKASMMGSDDLREDMTSDLKYGTMMADNLGIDGVQFDIWAAELARLGTELDLRIEKVQAAVEEAPFGDRLAEFAAWDALSEVGTAVILDQDVQSSHDTIAKLQSIPWPGQSGALEEADKLSHELLQEPMEHALRGRRGDFSWMEPQVVQAAGIEL